MDKKNSGTLDLAGFSVNATVDEFGLLRVEVNAGGKDVIPVINDNWQRDGLDGKSARVLFSADRKLNRIMLSPRCGADGRRDPKERQEFAAIPAVKALGISA